jgi:hypothetical protein
VCAWIWFSEIKYSQLKINHLNDTPSTKAARGGIYCGVLLKDIKVPVKVRRTLSSVGTSSSNTNIFQAQMAPMASLELVQAYMDNLLIIMRGILNEHLEKMETALTRLCDPGLKVNEAKPLFCAHEIEYLYCILARDGIKSQPKKVQVILVLNLPNNVEELRHFL